MKRERVKYKTIPDLMTAAEAGVHIGRYNHGDDRGPLGHLAVRRAAWAGKLGYYKIGRILYFAPEDVRRFNKGLPPIPQNKR